MRRVLAERTMHQVISLPLADPGTPDLTSPTAYLRWVGKGQWRTLVVAIAFGVVWLVSQALFPAAMGKAIDQGIIGGDAGALVLWCGILLGLVVVSALSGAMRHKYAVANWMQGAFRSAQLIGHKAADTGEALTRTVPTGDVVATVSSDAMRIGGLYDVTARFAGAVVAYVVVALILLVASTPLGLVVLIGGPLLLACLTFIVRPLADAPARPARGVRHGSPPSAPTPSPGCACCAASAASDLPAPATPTSRSRSARCGSRVAGHQAALDAAQVLLPGIFVLVVVPGSARAFAIAGADHARASSSPSTATPPSSPCRCARRPSSSTGRSAPQIGARKLPRILRVEPGPTPTDAGPRSRCRAGPASARTTRVSGVTIEPGRLTAVVSAPSRGDARRSPTGSAGSAPARPTCGSDGTRLADAAARARSVARSSSRETDPRLFTGPLRAELDSVGRRTTTPRSSRPCSVASGDDVLEALPGGLDSEVEERGRAFSGGQRQRLALTRALLTGRRHARARRADERRRRAHRGPHRRAARRGTARGRTTVVMTASPLLLDHADDVVFLRGRLGRRDAARTTSCMADDPGYRRIVVRGEED